MAISKIIADSITDEAVTSAKIAQGTVVAADVADGTITNAKIESVANTKITGVITNAQLANTTGSGAVVLVTSPTLVTPALGTPSALVGTNISGTAAGLTAGNVTTNANLTGQVTSVGNAAVLGSFTSAQLATALSDETGSGLAVFGTSPNLITPILGTPTSGNLTNCTGVVAAAMPAGSVLQVVSTTKTDTFTTTSTSYTSVTGLSVSITPSSASNKIMVFAYLSTTNTSQNGSFIRVDRDGSIISGSLSTLGTLDGTGANVRSSSGFITQSGTQYTVVPLTLQYLDSPSSTSSLTYQLKCRTGSGNTVLVNGNPSGANPDFGYYVSSITVMEIKG